MHGWACSIRDWGLWKALGTDGYGGSPYWQFQRAAEVARWVLEDCGLSAERRVVGRATVAIRNEWGEYVVRVHDQNGKRWPEADYFASHRDDAFRTAEAMLRG
jgi:hypothetical protein